MLFEPIHNENLNCFDDIIMNIAWDNGVHFEMFLSKSWNFSFRDGKGLIGEKMDACSGNDFESLKRIHGIRCDFVKKADRISFLPEVFQQNQYAAVFIDTYHCPWDKNYRKLHNPYHMVIVESIDSAIQCMIITDPFYCKNKLLLTFEAYDKAVGSGYAIMVNKTIVPVEWSTIKDITLERLIQTEAGIQEIRNLVEVIQTINLAKETGGYYNVWHSPIIFRMGRLALGRRRYSVLLAYLSEYYNYDFWDEIRLLKDSANQWDIIRTILVRCCTDGNVQELGRLNEMIIKVQKMENKAYENLIAIIAE